LEQNSPADQAWIGLPQPGRPHLLAGADGADGDAAEGDVDEAGGAGAGAVCAAPELPVLAVEAGEWELPPLPEVGRGWDAP